MTKLENWTKNHLTLIKDEKFTIYIQPHFKPYLSDLESLENITILDLPEEQKKFNLWSTRF